MHLRRCIAKKALKHRVGTAAVALLAFEEEIYALRLRIGANNPSSNGAVSQLSVSVFGAEFTMSSFFDKKKSGEHPYNCAKPRFPSTPPLIAHADRAGIYKAR